MLKGTPTYLGTKRGFQPLRRRSGLSGLRKRERERRRCLWRRIPKGMLSLRRLSTSHFAIPTALLYGWLPLSSPAGASQAATRDVGVSPAIIFNFQFSIPGEGRGGAVFVVTNVTFRRRNIPPLRFRRDMVPLRSAVSALRRQDASCRFVPPKAVYAFECSLA